MAATLVSVSVRPNCEEAVRVWIQNPFDNLPLEGFRKQRYWLMAEAFVAAGHQVVLWTSDFSHATKTFRRPDSTIPLPFDLRFLPTHPYFHNVGIRRVLSHRAYAREWIKQGLRLGTSHRPDVIISSMPTIAAAESALSLGRHFGAKTVIDVMDAWPETFERILPGPFRCLARLLTMPLRFRARRIYRSADFVTGVCDRYRDLTGRADYFRAYHGVELVPVSSLPQPLTSVSSCRLVYAGALGRTYDLDTVLKAVADNPDFTLDIAGKWTRGTQERVRAHGYLGQTKLADLLQSCDIGIIPMKSDSWVGMPYKIYDYARAELNIVSSLGGESAELLRKYHCGATYHPGDVQSLVVAIRQAMILNRGNSRKMCEEVFDAAMIYAHYVKVVEKLI